MKSAVPPLLQPDLEQNECQRLVQLRQTPNRGNKSFPPAQFKDAAGENRGWLLATDPRNPTNRYLTSRRSACRSVIAEGPQAGGLSARQWRDQISVNPPRCPPAAKYLYWSGGDHRVS
ncbi:hypothetical protein T12_5988 [Trichinella patagoniensis]|uniref:Uncharacterized protein n=1 Tax=Trichinella patagoniensis TaxID=990121 RepID=A0A0V0Z264_9BILA|nr:hypothetical protein T12_5988 [Trichinella patagoniensis]